MKKRNDRQPAQHVLVLELPAPLSVNRTRRINYAAMPAQKAWKQQADNLYLMQKRGMGKIEGPFEITIVINPASRLDLDNGLKGSLTPRVAMASSPTIARSIYARSLRSSGKHRRERGC